jgi:hypothetical protein
VRNKPLMILMITRYRYVNNVKADGIYRMVYEDFAIFLVNFPRIILH